MYELEAPNRRRRMTRGGVAAVMASAILLAAASVAGANYCLGNPTAEGCNVRPFGPHITSASISGGDLRLELTFHKAGKFVAYVKRNPPRNPYGRDWGAHPTFGKPIAIGFHPAGAGTTSVPLGQLAPGRYGVIVLPTTSAPVTSDQALDRTKAPSWVYFTQRAGQAVDIRVLQP
jgi:hypothetical protein